MRNKSVNLKIVTTDAQIGESIESACPDLQERKSHRHSGAVKSAPLTIVSTAQDAPFGSSIESSNPGGEAVSAEAAQIAISQEPATGPTTEQILETLAKAPRLRVCPPMISRLASMIGDPTVNPSEIEKTIKKDNWVATCTVEIANTNYFGLPRRIFYLREVLVFLGYMHVRNLAMTVAVLPLFKTEGGLNAALCARLWDHSLDVAILSRKIAEHMGLLERTSVAGEQAFTAGLLHDIGKLAFLMAMPGEYAGVEHKRVKQDVSFGEAERGHLPFSHIALGEAIAQRWNMPAVIADAIATHHNPGDAQYHPELAATVCLADGLSYAIDSDSHAAGVSLNIFDVLNSNACALLGLQRREIQSMVDVCRAELLKARGIHEALKVHLEN